MIDINKQIDYWRRGALEEWEVAQELLAHGRIRHGLFFVHLALEKALKAHVCRRTGELAPRVHNLLELSRLGGLDTSDTHSRVLAEMNAFNLEGRYPDEPTEALNSL